MSQTSKRSVLITGASTGIGAACAIELSKKGFSVFAGVRKTQDGEALLAQAKDIIPIILDVEKPDQISDAVRTVQSKCDGLDGLVNNAGIVVAGPLEYLPPEDLKRQFNINVFGLMEVTQKFLPLLRLKKGRIINMSSVSGLSSAPFLGPYCSSKFAVEALSDALRLELLPFGIEVILIEPGSIKTPIWDKTAEDSEQILKRMSPLAEQHYGKAFAAMRKLANKLRDTAAPVSEVTRVVEHALTAPTPCVRYKVGSGYRIQLLIEKLPTRLRDRILYNGMLSQ
ncbi:MAG: SDR family oxidoreductase [Oligoflexia bacterium]|nr:SDR family oxidoreductase [Oligoflexia bacterium]